MTSRLRGRGQSPTNQVRSGIGLARARTIPEAHRACGGRRPAQRMDRWRQRRSSSPQSTASLAGSDVSEQQRGARSWYRFRTARLFHRRFPLFSDVVADLLQSKAGARRALDRTVPFQFSETFFLKKFAQGGSSSHLGGFCTGTVKPLRCSLVEPVAYAKPS